MFFKLCSVYARKVKVANCIGKSHACMKKLYFKSHESIMISNVHFVVCFSSSRVLSKLDRCWSIVKEEYFTQSLMHLSSLTVYSSVAMCVSHAG